MFLLRVYNAIKPVTSFCQVFKVEICKANTTVTWQVDIICHKKELKIQLFFSFTIPWFFRAFFILAFYIVYPSKMQRQILFDVVIEFLFVIVRFLEQFLSFWYRDKRRKNNCKTRKDRHFPYFWIQQQIKDR